MTKKILLTAIRKFTFFPSAAELHDFFDALPNEIIAAPIEEIKSVVDTRSDWHVPTANRWFNHNKWWRGDRPPGNGGLFESIARRCETKELKND